MKIILSSNNANKLRVIRVLPKYLGVTFPTMAWKANRGLVSTEDHIWVGTYRQPRQARKPIWSRNARTPSGTIAAIEARPTSRSSLSRVTLCKGEKERMADRIHYCISNTVPRKVISSKWQHKTKEIHNSHSSSVYYRLQQNELLWPVLFILPKA